MPPEVSIIIPCYNKKHYVATAIESALSQSPDCEVIVVDDGSDDGSLEEIRRFGDRIRVVTGPNRGGCAARNIGMDLASGRWLQFFDADDVLPKGKIAAQLASLRAAPCNAIACCAWSILHDDDSIEPVSARAYWRAHEDGREMLRAMWHQGGFFPTLAWLVPREIALSIGGWNTALSADQDGEFFGRILARGGPVVFPESAMTLYRSPPIGAVSRDRSLRAAKSRMAAFETVAQALLAESEDVATRRACLSRVRSLAYALRDFDDLVDRAARWENRLGLNDCSPTLPPVTRALVRAFGIRRGLWMRALLKPARQS